MIEYAYLAKSRIARMTPTMGISRYQYPNLFDLHSYLSSLNRLFHCCIVGDLESLKWLVNERGAKLDYILDGKSTLLPSKYLKVLFISI